MPRAGPHAGFVGFAIFDDLIGGIAGAANGRDSEGQPGAVLGFAKIFLQMRMDSIRPGIAVRLEASTTFAPAGTLAECGLTLLMRLPSITISTSVRAV